MHYPVVLLGPWLIQHIFSLRDRHHVQEDKCHVSDRGGKARTIESFYAGTDYLLSITLALLAMGFQDAFVCLHMSNKSSKVNDKRIVLYRMTHN